MDENKQAMNPYEAPQAIKDFTADGLSEPAYAVGQDLVFRSDFVSPKVCILTGQNIVEHVRPIRVSIFKLYLLNHSLARAVYLAMFGLLILFLIVNETDRLFFNIPLYILLAVHFLPLFLKNNTHVNFYLAEYLRIKEIKKARRHALIFILLLAVIVYGYTTGNYFINIIGYILILNYFLIVKSDSALKFMLGNENYYRLGDVHPNFLARFPRLEA